MPDQTKSLSRGLKFIPTPVTKENRTRQQLLQDLNQFTRRMRLRYIFHRKNKEQHPVHVKSHWVPPVQQSVALESYLEGVKTELAEILLLKLKHNLPHNERKAIKEPQVIMSRHNKIKEGHIQLDDLDNYRPLEQPMVEEKVKQIISELYQRNHIDSMTKKWLLQTPNPPCIPVFYILTKIHKAKPVGRPIISSCDGPTEPISSFVDSLLQPVAKVQKGYLKDTTEFINFIERMKVPKNTFLVSMDVTSLYTNIPQEEGTTVVCNAYEVFHENNPPTPTALLREMLGLVLKENSFQFNGRNYLQTHGTAMGTKMAVAFANIFMCAVETDILSQSNTKLLEWKRYIDDVFSLWDSNTEEIDNSISSLDYVTKESCEICTCRSRNQLPA